MSKRIPPLRFCVECSRPVGHFWTAFQTCAYCRASDPYGVRAAREARRQERLDSLERREPPKW